MLKITKGNKFKLSDQKKLFSFGMFLIALHLKLNENTRCLPIFFCFNVEFLAWEKKRKESSVWRAEADIGQSTV